MNSFCTFNCYILDSSVSQATAGIVAAIFCAVVFIGVGLLRCMMMGACNSCGGPNPADNHHDRQVVATNDSYTYRADFPPSYSTGMFLTFLSQLSNQQPHSQGLSSFCPCSEMEARRETLGTRLFDQELMTVQVTLLNMLFE